MEKFGPFVIVEASRYEALESTEKHVTNLVTAGSAQLRNLREEIASLKSALQFYADRASWRPRGIRLAEGGKTESPIAAHDDRGRRARKALGIPT